MIPGFDIFSTNLMYTGGEDGGKSVIMIHSSGDLGGAREIGSGLFIGGVASAQTDCAEGIRRPRDFKFFFNHVRLTEIDLNGMLSGGGWFAVRLTSNDAIRAALRHGESGLWDELRYLVRSSK
jgi:hypothetical protein